MSNKELTYSERESETGGGGANRKDITLQVLDFSKREEARGGFVCADI